MIRVNEKYVIMVDLYNYTAAVDFHKTDKNGRPMTRTIGHYKSLPDAVGAIAARESAESLSGNEEMPLSEAVEIISDVYGRFTRILEEINSRERVER